MVPGEYSAPRTGTISGRACAVFVARRPAPIVAKSATAIRFDIDVLRSANPCRGPEICPNRRICRLTHAFLTACVNPMVSTRAFGRVRAGGEDEILDLK